MTATPPLVRFSALLAPTLLLPYGLLRLIDGDHGPGLAWNLGHTLFFIAFVLFAVLIVGLRRLVPATTVRTRTIATLATVAGLFGVVLLPLGDPLGRREGGDQHGGGRCSAITVAAPCGAGCCG
jgi:hypothetical protein